jgi:hypothetical protein
MSGTVSKLTLSYVLYFSIPIYTYFYHLHSRSQYRSFFLYYLYLILTVDEWDGKQAVKDWKGRLQMLLARRYRGVVFKICYDAPKSEVILSDPPSTLFNNIFIILYISSPNCLLYPSLILFLSFKKNCFLRMVSSKPS